MNPEQQLAKEMAATNDWRGPMYEILRNVVGEFEPPLTLNWKWNSAIWSGKKDVLSLSPFKAHMKINFFNGAHLDKFQTNFNNGLEAKNSRSIDFHENDKIDEELVRQIIAAAVAYDANKS